MFKNRIAACYFPTKIVFVDDGFAYLKSLRVGLDATLAFQFYTDPHAAIEMLKSSYEPISFLEKWTTNLNAANVKLGEVFEEEKTTHAYIDINIESIRQEIYSSDRFNGITVVVVDYSMPGMNGIDFCRALADVPVKKIMLTGLASHDVAVAAFNEGAIDKFIRKESHNFYSELHEAIASLQHAYFKELSQPIIQNLSANPNSCLSDPVFADFFKVIREKHQIAEYYLVNESGSFLMLDAAGNPSWLLVKSESDMELNFDTAQGNYAPDAIQESLKKRERLLFLLTKHEEWSVPIDEWDNYMHLATKLVGENSSYYCAFVEGPAKYDIHPEKIQSYRQFLDMV